jgi:hypothetical protein
VPDFLAFDLVQARCTDIHVIPMLAICDTPFYGMNAVKKLAIDIILSGIGLLLTLPLTARIALAVKVSSPGPVLVKRRRYGLLGDEILVYKFRSMTVCEDGPVVVQARLKDGRITAVGGLLRRTSLDELPQLFNVLQGQDALRWAAAARDRAQRAVLQADLRIHHPSQDAPVQDRLGTGAWSARRDPGGRADAAAGRIRSRVPAPLVAIARPADPASGLQHRLPARQSILIYSRRRPYIGPFPSELPQLPHNCP